MNPRYVGLLDGITLSFIFTYGCLVVCSAITSVLFSFMSRLYYFAHSSVARISLFSCSGLVPNNIISSAKSRWFSHPSIPGILTPQYYRLFNFLDSISGMTLNHIGEDMPPCLTPFYI